MYCFTYRDESGISNFDLVRQWYPYPFSLYTLYCKNQSNFKPHTTDMRSMHYIDLVFKVSMYLLRNRDFIYQFVTFVRFLFNNKSDS